MNNTLKKELINKYEPLESINEDGLDLVATFRFEEFGELTDYLERVPLKHYAKLCALVQNKNEKIELLLNSEQSVQVSDTTMLNSSNDDGNKKIEGLREKFFKECTYERSGVGTYKEIITNSNPEEIFDFFKPYLKGTIDWEGLSEKFLKDFVNDVAGEYYLESNPYKIHDWLKTNINNYIKNDLDTGDSNSD